MHCCIFIFLCLKLYVQHPSLVKDNTSTKTILDFEKYALVILTDDLFPSLTSTQYFFSEKESESTLPPDGTTAWRNGFWEEINIFSGSLEAYYTSVGSNVKRNIAIKETAFTHFVSKYA